MTTVKDALEQAIQRLIQANSAAQETRGARLDAQLLLSHVTGYERAHLYAYPERVLADEQERAFFALIERRQQGEPLAYLVGHKEFYGLDLLVDQRVLIPRPETELLVEAALRFVRARLDSGEQPLVADIGTGSGAIPIALAVAEPRLQRIYACDISTDALTVARANCQRQHVEERISLCEGDLLAALPEAVDLLTANLPYVGTEEITQLAPDVLHYEPHLALFSGPKGLGLLYRFFAQAKEFDKLKEKGSILVEIGYQQKADLTLYIHELWPHATVVAQQDYAGWDRLLQIYL